MYDLTTKQILISCTVRFNEFNFPFAKPSFHTDSYTIIPQITDLHTYIKSLSELVHDLDVS